MFQKTKNNKGGWVSGGMAADIAWDPSSRPRCGPWLTTMQRTSALVWMPGRRDDQDSEAARRCHIFTPREIACAHGWPAARTKKTQSYEACAGFDWAAMPPLKAFTMLGNSMHLHSMGAWFAYVFANALRRSTAREFLPPLRLLYIPPRTTAPDNTLPLLTRSGSNLGGGDDGSEGVGGASGSGDPRARPPQSSPGRCFSVLDGTLEL